MELPLENQGDGKNGSYISEDDFELEASFSCSPIEWVTLQVGSTLEIYGER
jgi:hypothetical protein